MRGGTLSAVLDYLHCAQCFFTCVLAGCRSCVQSVLLIMDENMAGVKRAAQQSRTSLGDSCNEQHG